LDYQPEVWVHGCFFPDIYEQADKEKVTNDYILKDFVQNVGDPPAEENFDFINL